MEWRLPTCGVETVLFMEWSGECGVEIVACGARSVECRM